MITNGFVLSIDKDRVIKGKDIMGYRAWNGYGLKDYDRFSVLYYPICNDGSNDSNLLINGFMIDGCNGNYAYIHIDEAEGVIRFARDPLGCKPLYYEHSNDCISIASDKRVLEDAKRAEPGVVYTYSLESDTLIKDHPCMLRFNPFCTSTDDAVEMLHKLLDSVIHAICKISSKVAVGLSGIDSIIVAEIASRYADVNAVTVCMKGSYDYKHAGINNGFKHDLLVIDEHDILDSLRSLSLLDIERSAMHLSIACIVHILARYARDNGLKVLMLGQLADELFAGYARYLNYDPSMLNGILFKDVINAERCLLRDDYASCSYALLALPYAVYSIAQYAVNIPAELKVSQGIRKLVLRRLAEHIGIDKHLAYKEKKAMQYSSGVYKVISKMLE